MTGRSHRLWRPVPHKSPAPGSETFILTTPRPSNQAPASPPPGSGNPTSAQLLSDSFVFRH